MLYVDKARQLDKELVATLCQNNEYVATPNTG